MEDLRAELVGKKKKKKYESDFLDSAAFLMAAARLRQRFRFLNDREKKEGCLILQ